jgi:hypothetical protein
MIDCDLVPHGMRNTNHDTCLPRGSSGSEDGVCGSNAFKKVVNQPLQPEKSLVCNCLFFILKPYQPRPIRENSTITQHPEHCFFILNHAFFVLNHRFFILNICFFWLNEGFDAPEYMLCRPEPMLLCPEDMLFSPEPWLSRLRIGGHLS